MKAGTTIVLLALMLVAGQASVLAQTPSSPAPADYVLGPGDVVDVIVLGHTDLTQTFVIGPDGYIAMPLIGRLRAAGKTTAQLTAELTEAYRRYLRNPAVTVRVREYRVQRVTLLGQVNKPGSYEYQEGNRLSDALALAGGLTALAAPRKATLTRGNQTIPLDLDKILKEGDAAANLTLQPGDMVVVPEEGSRVAVLGFVQKPGAYAIKEGDRVLDAIVMAGGNTDRGDLSAVSIVRQTSDQPTVVKVDLKKATQGDIKQNILLQDRDVIFVAEVGSPDPNKVVPWLSVALAFLRILFGIGL